MNSLNSYNLLHCSRLPKILTLVLLLLSSQFTLASNNCSNLFSKHSNIDFATAEQKNNFGTLRKDFALDPRYKVEIPDQSDIKNQCNLGTCHLHSWVSLLEHDFKSAVHEDIKISTHYLSIRHWIRQSLELLDSDSGDQVDIQLGANVFGSRRSILSSGIIPDEAWTGSRDFQSATLSDRITEYVKNITARAKWQINKQTDRSKAEKIREKAEGDILNIFENLVGKIPTTFSFRGKEFTPMSFQKKFFPELNKPITNIVVSADRKSPTTLNQSGQLFTVISANIDTVESVLKNLLDRGQNVYLSYDHNAEFVDAKSGIMSISAFNLPSGAGPLSRDQRNFFEISSGGHAVQIVGYDYDQKTNKIIKWKIKNSWGEKSGDHGYYHMFNDYFRAFVRGISFYSNPAFTPTIEEKDPTQLELRF
jgi:bleomycin hydrolase